MRIRKKKHLDERVKNVRNLLVIADNDILNSTEANQDKRLFDFKSIFGNERSVEIEIGCGKGGFIIEKAKREQSVNFVAVELLQNIIVMAAEAAVRENVKNVLFFNCGADYLPRYVPSKSVKAVYLNFSPPFNGKRYENRRLTKPELVSFYKDVLMPGGAVYQKTDDKDFFEYSMEKFREGGFIVTETVLTDSDNVQTEYEKKFRKIGLPIYSFKAQKQ